MYEIITAPKVERALKRITKLHKEAVAEALLAIKEDPFLGKPLTRELTGKLSYRVGSYRIIYTINKADKIIYTPYTQVYK